MSVKNTCDDEEKRWFDKVLMWRNEEVKKRRLISAEK